MAEIPLLKTATAKTVVHDGQVSETSFADLLAKCFQFTERGDIVLPAVTVSAADKTIQPSALAIDWDTLRTITQGLTPAEVANVLTQLKNGGEYRQMAEQAAETVAEKFTPESVTSFLKSENGKLWFLDKQKAVENLTARGVPLAFAITSLFGLKELADIAGLENPAVRFAFIVKGAGWSSIPVREVMQHIYQRQMLKMPADGVATRMFSVRAAEELVMAKVPMQIPVSDKIATAFRKEFSLNGAKLFSAATAKRFATWLPKTTYHMGRGLILSNAGDYLYGDLLEKNFGSTAREINSLLLFFGEDIGDFLTYGGFSKFLKSRGIGPAFSTLAGMAGVFFTSEMTDYGLVAVIEGNRKATYVHSLSIRAAQRHPTLIDAPFIALFGESTKANYCSGRNFGLATDGLQALWVAFDFMDESETCKGLRAEIYREDERAVRAHIKAIKEQFKELLINPTPAKYKGAQSAPQFMGIMGADSPFEAVVVWRRRIADGWFFGVDNSLTNNATGSFIDPQLVESVRNLSRLYTESSDPLRWVFSQALLDLGRKKPVPPATVLLEDSKLAEFLNWLGGEEEILKKRKQYFISVLIQTDIKRISGFMSENDMALLEEGVKAGFLTKSGQNYEFRRDRDYFEVLSRQTLNAVVNDDIQQIKNLAMYASHKIQKLGENKENAFDLQILSPIIESIATKGQFELNEAVVSIYTGQSDKNDAFLAAMKTVAAEFEQLLKAEAAQDAATDIEIGAISGAKECFEQFNSSSYPDIESCLSAKSIMNSKYEKLAYALKILRKMDPARFEKIIDTEGRFMSEEKAYKWAKKEYLQAVKNLRGLDKFEPEERKIWSDNLLLMAEAKIALLKRRIASEIILKTIFDHFPKGETDFFETWSARAFKHLSAIYKTLHKESKNVDAAKISSLFENSFNGMIDPVSGAIKDNKSFDKWISDEVIKTADIQLEQLEKQLKTYLSITVTSEEQDEALKQLIAFNQLAKEAVQKAKSYYNDLKD